MIEVKINHEAVASQISQAISKLTDATPMMASVAAELLSQTEANFSAEGRPRWLGLKYPRADGKAGKLLQRSAGGLAASIQTFHTANSAGIGSNKVYAAIHQFGGQTKSHIIKAKNAKALKFNGRFAKSVNHPGSKIPARPFLPITKAGDLQEQAVAGIESIVQIYLKSIAGE
ncbi:phage virion morphogenesis protein [Undibacterium sp. SXout11W]|uniref:phage virion morphogenesis protein n=1 Tax=Undibacterium sp. SXout11W TaxID=3413050 RepID=UPI003BEFFA8D